AEPNFVWMSRSHYAIHAPGGSGARGADRDPRRSRFIPPLDGCFVSLRAANADEARRRIAERDIEARGLRAFAAAADTASPAAAMTKNVAVVGPYVAVFGSFRDVRNAEAALARLRASAELAEHRDRIAIWTIRVDGAALRRVVVGGFASRDAAADLCARAAGAAACF
ncbi:MAG: SPOR domain-containing protein, partial [Pseudomonadota bacterium]